MLGKFVCKKPSFGSATDRRATLCSTIAENTESNRSPRTRTSLSRYLRMMDLQPGRRASSSTSALSIRPYGRASQRPAGRRNSMKDGRDPNSTQAPRSSVDWTYFLSRSTCWLVLSLTLSLLVGRIGPFLNVHRQSVSVRPRSLESSVADRRSPKPGSPRRTDERRLSPVTGSVPSLWGRTLTGTVAVK